jgi:hypothetical protein
MKNRRGVFIALSLAVLLIGAAGAMAKNAMSFALDRPMTIGDKTVGPGKCEITWATHSPQTDVNIYFQGKVIAELHGKMVERGIKADYNSLVTVKDRSGKDVLKEIRFAGKKSVIVLD